MGTLKGACIFGQSGGPTAVINASASGVIQEALKQDNILKAVLGQLMALKVSG
jgi:6-phosphofructokinase